MNINATIQATLQCESHDIVLEYNEFVPTPFDAYIIASLIKNTKNKESEIYEYIDEVSGDGSLNKYFRDLYKQMKDFDEADIENILVNNLYPIDVVDDSNKLLYYPQIDVTSFNDKFYKGSLENDEDLIKSKLVNPSDTSKTFKKFSISDATKTNVMTYKFLVNFTNNYVSLNVVGINDPIQISYSQFRAICAPHLTTSEVDMVYRGMFQTDATGDNWFLLTKNIYDGFIKNPFKYVGKDRNLHIVSTDKIETIEFLSVASDLLFYRRIFTPISSKYLDKCTEALDYLINSKNINQYGADNIIAILQASEQSVAQRALVGLLVIKDSYRLVDYALQLFFNGMTDGWNADALRKMKARCPHERLKDMYVVNTGLNYTISDLLYIDDEILSEEDKDQKHEYLSKVSSYKDEINRMLGEMTSSGVRENLKKLSKKDQLLIQFNKFLNEYIGHNKVNIMAINDLDELQKHYNIIKNQYDNAYPAVRKRIEMLMNN